MLHQEGRGCVGMQHGERLAELRREKQRLQDWARELQGGAEEELGVQRVDVVQQEIRKFYPLGGLVVQGGGSVAAARALWWIRDRLVVAERQLAAVALDRPGTSFRAAALHPGTGQQNRAGVPASTISSHQTLVTTRRKAVPARNSPAPGSSCGAVQGTAEAAACNTTGNRDVRVKVAAAGGVPAAVQLSGRISEEVQLTATLAPAMSGSVGTEAKVASTGDGSALVQLLGSESGTGQEEQASRPSGSSYKEHGKLAKSPAALNTKRQLA